MKRSVQMLFLIAIANVFAILPAWATDAHDLFQQALVAERTAGDLQKAISLYENVVETPDTDRRLTVQALLQLGAAYEKLGQTRAAEAYQRIVQEFSDHPKAVAAARERLSRLSASETGMAKKSSGPISRQLWSDVGDDEGEVSRDGRWFSFIDWETGDVAVRDLRSGENRRLFDSGDWTVSKDFGGQMRFSPDAKWVAYTWYDNERPAHLRMVGTEPGSKPQELLRDKSIFYAEPGRFSADGSRLLVAVHRVDGPHQLGILTLANRELKVLLELDHHPHPIEFSADGRHILYAAAPEDGQPRDLYVIQAGGGDPIAIASHPSIEKGAGFSPEGDRIVFVSGRSGTESLWEIDFRDGQPVGEPRLVRPDLGTIMPYGIAADGAFYYGVKRGFEDAYIADLGADGKISAKPRRLGEIQGRDHRANWSADGSTLVYLSDRGAGNPSRPKQSVVVFRDTTSGKERVLVSEVESPRRPVSIALSPDQKHLALYGTTLPDREEGMYIVDASRGVGRRIDATTHSHPAWSPDSTTLYYYDRLTDRPVIRAYRLADQSYHTLLSAAEGHDFGAIALSPDGRWLAFRKVEGDYSKSDILQLLPVAGGEPRDILRRPVTRRGSNISDAVGLAFTPDGQYLLFGRWEDWSTNNDNRELFRVPVSGGEAQPLGLKMPRLIGLAIHPNGEEITFTAGTSSFSELWVLENFLGDTRRTHAP